jgi:hypothetical protein
VCRSKLRHAWSPLAFPVFGRDRVHGSSFSVVVVEQQAGGPLCRRIGDVLRRCTGGDRHADAGYDDLAPRALPSLVW